MDDSFARRWPGLLILAGAGLALNFGVTYQAHVASARELHRIRDEVRDPSVRSCVIIPPTAVPPRGLTRLECGAGLIAGAHLLLLGICLLTRATGRFPGRVLWRRDGGLARGLWSTLLLAGAALQAWMILQFASTRDPALLLWMSGLAPAFVIPLIALTGSYRATPTSA